MRSDTRCARPPRSAPRPQCEGDIASPIRDPRACANCEPDVEAAWVPPSLCLGSPSQSCLCLASGLLCVVGPRRLAVSCDNWLKQQHAVRRHAGTVHLRINGASRRWGPIGLATMSGQSRRVMHTSDETMLHSVRVRSIGAEISVPTLSAVLRGAHSAPRIV